MEQTQSNPLPIETRSLDPLQATEKTHLSSVRIMIPVRFEAKFDGFLNYLYKISLKIQSQRLDISLQKDLPCSAELLLE